MAKSLIFGAGNGIRTRDLQLGKLVFLNLKETYIVTYCGYAKA